MEDGARLSRLLSSSLADIIQPTTSRGSTNTFLQELENLLKTQTESKPRGGGETSDERTSCPPLRSAHTPTLGSVPHPSLRDPVWFCSAQVVLREFTEDKPVFPPGRTPDEGGDCSTDLSRDASTAPPSVQEQNRGGGPTPGSSLTSSSWI